jgi:hypothetical protein
MQIEVKQNKDSVLFKDVYAGVVFQYDDFYYIKVSETFKIEFTSYNAISLDDGDPVFFNNNDEVFVPSAKLVIEWE